MGRSFEGTHVAITGGGSGIGLELARQFMRLGAVAVSLLDISDCSGVIPDLMAESAGSCGIKAYRADVTEYQQARMLTPTVTYSPAVQQAAGNMQLLLSAVLLAGSAGHGQRGAAAGPLH